MRRFSRGALPYSLHLKSMLIETEEDTISVLSSSSLAVRDKIKMENLIICENDRYINEPNRLFFSHLIQTSIPIQDFDLENDYTNYEVPIFQNPSNSKCFFISPFYENSPFEAEERLRSLIHKAKRRIYIAAQHIAAYKYAYPGKFAVPACTGSVNKNGFLFDVIEKASQGLDVRCLSQTFVNSNGESLGCRKPQNKGSFAEFIKHYERQPTARYACNSNFHSKYIIIDDAVVITSCNFTPTEFIYLKNVNIPRFYGMPGMSYNGIFSEVGQYLFLKEQATIGAYLEDFQNVWNLDSTRKLIH